MMAAFLPQLGTQFTCFTSTTVQILTPKDLRAEWTSCGALTARSSFTCVTGTKVQILTQKALAVDVLWRADGTQQLYLRYWYKSTNSDTEGAGSGCLVAR
jgi:hypothetical protein